MGGEFPDMKLLTTKNKRYLVVIQSSFTRRIFPPMEARVPMIEELHSGGRKTETLVGTLRAHYIWPGMRKQVAEHISGCTACEKMRPGKSAAVARGLQQKISELKPLDWLCADLMSVADTKGGAKKDYIMVVDRSSGYCWTKNLPGTKA